MVEKSFATRSKTMSSGVRAKRPVAAKTTLRKIGISIFLALALRA